MVEKNIKDRRVIRTKTALRQAINEIIKEKEYSNITVEDITSRANIGRTTFYLHYQDKEDLLLEELEEQLSLIANEFSRHPLIFWIREQNGIMIKSILEIIKNNSELYRCMTHDQSNKAYERFKKINSNAAWKLINESPWAQRRISHMSIPVDFLIEFYAGAMWSSIVWWVSNNFEVTIDEMASSCRMLLYPGLLRALNIRKASDLVENS